MTTVRQSVGQRDRQKLEAREHTLCAERLVGVTNERHNIRTLALLLAVPQDAALRLNVAEDDAGDGRAEGLLEVASAPDEEPVLRLSTGAERGSYTGTGADANAAPVEIGCVGDTGELVDVRWSETSCMEAEFLVTYLDLARPDMGRRVLNKTACEVTLYTADHVMCAGALALARRWR